MGKAFEILILCNTAMPSCWPSSHDHRIEAELSVQVKSEWLHRLSMKQGYTLFDRSLPQSFDKFKRCVLHPNTHPQNNQECRLHELLRPYNLFLSKTASR